MAECPRNVNPEHLDGLLARLDASLVARGLLPPFGGSMQVRVNPYIASAFVRGKVTARGQVRRSGRVFAAYVLLDADTIPHESGAAETAVRPMLVAKFAAGDYYDMSLPESLLVGPDYPTQNNPPIHVT